MTDQPLPQVAPKARVELEDVRATLSGLAPGWYTTADLLPRYEAVARAAGRDPGNRQRLGLGLGKVVKESAYAHDHVTAWHVTEELTDPS